MEILTEDRDKIAYNINEAALACGVSPKTISRAYHAGDIHGIRPAIEGRAIQKVVFLRSELERWASTEGMEA